VYGRCLAATTGQGDTRRSMERLARTSGDAGTLAAAVAAALARREASAPPAQAPRPTARSVPQAAPADLYRHGLENKLSYLEATHGLARRRRGQRYDLATLTLEQYRLRVAESLERVLGPALPETQDRRARTRLAVRRPQHDVYEVVLESVPGIDVAGYLLLPHEPEPVPAVICQHGLGGRPNYLAGLEDNWIYDRLAERLADKGYVTFAPFMNWGWGGTPGRDALVKRAYALGLAPNRFEVAQLHAVVDFLQARPEVEGRRIAFYGLSYGGHASLWLGACEERLAAVVTAGHFNDWQNKLTSVEVTAPQTRPTSYVTVDEGYDMFTYNILNEVGHGELATRFAPRPYMVENGLRDAVTPTAWVEQEYRRVQAVFAWMDAPQNAVLAHFDGPHRVWAEESVLFLHQHMKGHDSGHRGGEE
jgi:dienelactone hydrolase